MIVTSFARELKRLRAERGLTIRDLAAAVHKSVAYLAKIEVQGEIPTSDLICELARTLEASPAELLGLARQDRLHSVARDIDREYARAMADYVDAKRTAGKAKESAMEKMATIVSMINMKGGVGKTTLAMQLAHTADAQGLRTLAIDLDPQANLSHALMGPKAYVEHVEEDRPTIVQIFEEFVPRGGHKALDINDIILKQVGYRKRNSLDLIPSRLELSRRTMKQPAGKERRLAKALAQIRKAYDLVIIDCAPTESILTDAAYFASRYIVVPIKPEFMATIGLPLLARSLQEFHIENDDNEVEIAGLVFNHSSSYSAGPEGQQSIREVTKFSAEHGWRICENQVRYSASYAKSAREQTPLSRTSYARFDVVDGFQSLAHELFDLIGVASQKTGSAGATRARTQEVIGEL